jgi:glycosyltransferase involved in cell wall biosynthesis
MINGVVRSIQTFRDSFAQQGHCVFIFAQGAGGYREREAFVFRYPAVVLPVSHQYPVTIPVSRHIDWLLPALKLDVVHSHHPFLLGEVAAKKATALGVPLVFTYHTRYIDYSHYVPLSQKLVKSAIEHYLASYMKKCHHVIVPSAGMKERLAQVYGITDQISTVATGLDLSLWQAADGQAMRQTRGWGTDTVLISVGRLAREKNWPTLLRGVAPLLRTRANTRLVLVGDGDERKSLGKLASELGIATRVEFTGNLSHPQVIACLKAADLFCFASVTETQGLVTMEAMAAGLPVVAVEATGTRDVITHGQEGLLVENESAALTRAIKWILGDEVLQKRLSAKALERVRGLATEAQTQKMLAVYEQAREDQLAGCTVKVTNPKLTGRLRWRDIFADALGGT